MANPKIIVEKHQGGYLACPLGLKGSVVGQGNRHEAVLAEKPFSGGRHKRPRGTPLTFTGQVDRQRRAGRTDRPRSFIKSRPVIGGGVMHA